MLVNKQIKKQVILIVNILKVGLTFKYKKNAYIHFIYGELKIEEKIKSWEKITIEINKWRENNVIVRDFNIIQNQKKDVWRQLETEITIDAAINNKKLVNIIRKMNVSDMFRILKNEEKKYFFFRTDKKLGTIIYKFRIKWTIQKYPRKWNRKDKRYCCKKDWNKKLDEISKRTNKRKN